MGAFLQKQPYNLTMAKRKLGIHQERIMVHAVEAMQPYMSTNVDYTSRVPDLYLKLKVKDLVKGNNFKPLRSALNGLMKSIVRIMHYIPEEATYLEVGTPLIQSYEYKHGSSEVELKFSGKLVPQLIDLARGYTKYSLHVAFNTSSPKIFKLYQYIAHFRDKKQIQCNVSTLRSWLQIEGKYALPGHIKQKILTPAMHELKAKADVWFEIAERITEGRRMIGWKFNIYTKKQPKAIPKPQLLAQPKNEKLAGLQQELVSKYGLSPKQAQNAVKKIDIKDLYKELYQINLRILNRELKNVGGYSAKILGDKFNVKL